MLEFISEIGINHNGKLNIAKKTINSITISELHMLNFN